MKNYKLIIEKHPDGYVAYPIGMQGVVVGQGDTYQEALQNVKSAIKFHLESFGEEYKIMKNVVFLIVFFFLFLSACTTGNLETTQENSKAAKISTTAPSIDENKKNSTTTSEVLNKPTVDSIDNSSLETPEAEFTNFSAFSRFDLDIDDSFKIDLEEPPITDIEKLPIDASDMLPIEDIDLSSIIKEEDLSINLTSNTFFLKNDQKYETDKCFYREFFDKNMNPIEKPVKPETTVKWVLNNCLNSFNSKKYSGLITKNYKIDEKTFTRLTIAENLSINGELWTFKVKSSRKISEKINTFEGNYFFVNKKGEKISKVMYRLEEILNLTGKKFRRNSGKILRKEGEKNSGEFEFLNLIYLYNRAECKFPLNGLLKFTNSQNRQWQKTIKNINENGSYSSCSDSGEITELP